MAGRSRIWAIVPAAGIGQRFGSDRPKQYVKLLNQSVLAHTLRVLAEHADISGILVGIAEGDARWQETQAELGKTKKLFEFVGGAQRQETVLLGLKKLATLADEYDSVLVHDAVRPLLRQSDISKLLASVGDDSAGSILGLPVKDTLKVEKNGRSQSTLDRSHLWQALTPQYFRIDHLTQAMEYCAQNNITVTDEAAAMEQIGMFPKLVTGHSDNIKITYPEDIVLAEQLLKKQNR